MLKPFMVANIIEAGCDEAGRGPLAGSVFCAAVILNPERVNSIPEFEWLNDSKQLTDKQRYALRPVIEREAISWAVVEVTAKEIDERKTAVRPEAGYRTRSHQLGGGRSDGERDRRTQYITMLHFGHAACAGPVIRSSATHPRGRE